MLCYHTCATEGGLEFVRNSAPFLSKEHKSGSWQWLTQGYYFWTDHPHYAHQWGKKSYSDRYAVMECTLLFEPDTLLDLAGNTTDSIYFSELVSMYVKKLSRANPRFKVSTLTVSSVIQHYRVLSEKEPALFPYQAIKAVDVPNGGYRENQVMRFIPTRMESLPLIPRLQICLFENYESVIKNKNIVHFSS
ncbi:hypothetical protein [Aeromonas jandaei]|uniref:hypothetical protein n=1 Tax=Aeromonas jandaei TaxID=650 RepID=UPI003BA18443